MFDIGFSELVLIGLVALIVLGPQRLPEVARAAGRWAARLRGFIDGVKRDMDSAIKDDELAALRKAHAELLETRQLLENSAGDTFGKLTEAAQNPVPADSGYLVKASPALETRAAPKKTKRAAPRKSPARRAKAAVKRKHVRSKKSRAR